MPRYRVLVGITYGDGKHAEPGEIVDDIPPGAAKTYLADGVVEKVGDRRGSGTTQRGW